MITVFFALLFVPMSHISDAEKSEQENRMLAQKPHISIYDEDGNNYGTQFDAWYNDHFFGRDAMNYLYNYIKFYINPKGENHKAMVGQNGFLWLKWDNHIKMFQNNDLFDAKQLKIIGENINKFVHNTQKAGVKNVYFMLSNDKESMYPEYYPSYMKKVGKVSRLEQLIEYMHSKYPQIKILNFRNKFEEIKKKNTVFFKTGTHMSNIGTFYEYYFLVNAIKQDYPDLDILIPDDFDTDISDDIEKAGTDIDIYKEFVVLPRYAKSNFKNKILRMKSGRHKEFKYIDDFNICVDKKYYKYYIDCLRGENTNINNKLKLFIIGDSFSVGYARYLFETFSKVDRVFFGEGGDFFFPEDIVRVFYDNIPDIFIVETTERFLPRFLTLEFPNNPNVDN